MFWKNVNSYFLSIRVRLALLYSLSALILLSLIAAFLYWESVNMLTKANYQFLTDEVQTLRYLLNQEEITSPTLKKVVIDIPSDTDNSIYCYFVRLVNAKGQTLLETPNIDKIFPKEIYTGNFSAIKTHFRNFTRDNREFLLIKAPFKTPKHIKGEIQIVLDVTHQHQVMDDRKILFYSFLVITLFVFLLGFYVTHKGLKSLYTLTETTRKITIGSLSKRIDPEYWPSELRKLGLSFNQMLTRIESSIIHLRQFSADLAHEMRTPINNLIGQTEIALSYSKTIEDYQQVMSSNLEELHRMSQLVENILFLARAENPELQIEKNKINVRDEVMVLKEYYEALLQEKSIEINCKGDGQIAANPVMFRRALSNLISNSIKYSDLHSIIEFNIVETKDYVEIQMRDTGFGIETQHLPRIFERFYRIENDRCQKSGGTGLGLPIVKSIVELHKGTIHIASELNIGTTITMQFAK